MWSFIIMCMYTTRYQFSLEVEIEKSNSPLNLISDVLNKESLQQVLTESCENIKVQGWRPVWALRYSVLVKCRGVIKNKGWVEHVVNLSLVQFELHVCCSYTVSLFLAFIFQEFQAARRPNCTNARAYNFDSETMFSWLCHQSGKHFSCFPLV